MFLPHIRIVTQFSELSADHLAAAKTLRPRSTQSNLETLPTHSLMRRSMLSLTGSTIAWARTPISVRFSPLAVGRPLRTQFSCRPSNSPLQVAFVFFILLRVNSAPVSSITMARSRLQNLLVDAILLFRGASSDSRFLVSPCYKIHWIHLLFPHITQFASLRRNQFSTPSVLSEHVMPVKPETNDLFTSVKDGILLWSVLPKFPPQAKARSSRDFFLCPVSSSTTLSLRLSTSV